MKRKNYLLLYFALLLLFSCAKKDTSSEIVDVFSVIYNDDFYIPEVNNTTSTNNLYQSENNMLSTYRENKSDGYTWRYREMLYDINDETVSKEKLLSTIWKMNPSINQYALLVFYSDDVFKIGTYQGGVSIQGNYKIENSKVYLSNYNTEKFINQFLVMGESETECVLNFSSTNVQYNNELIISEVQFFPLGSEKTNGDKGIIQDINVIVDKNTFVFNDTVRFRAGPSLNSELLVVKFYDAYFYEMGKKSIITNSFKKGTKVYTLARTDYTEEIENKTAPWYYIVVSDGFEGNQYGWVFGAYFDPFIKENESTYWEILHAELGLNNHNER